MDRRLELQTLFEELLGSRNVYFQPPSSVKMSYPAIVYSRKDIESTYANDNAYLQNLAYEVTVIDPNPDSEIVGKMATLQHCSFDRHYTADNLNHDVFKLYF